MFSNPNVIKLIHGLFNDFRVICQDASFKVASRFRLHSDTSTCEICTTDIYFFSVEHKHLKMNTRTKHSLQTVIEYWVHVKILTKDRTWFFCMNEPYLHTTPNELGYKCQEWLLELRSTLLPLGRKNKIFLPLLTRNVLFAHLHIKVFDVGGANPKQVLHGLNP